MKKEMIRYIFINALTLAVMITLSLVYFSQPTVDALGINRMVQDFTAIAMVFTIIVCSIANAMVYVIAKFN